MKNSTVIASPSSYYVVITTIAYALLYPRFFELDNTYGEGVNFVINNNDKTMTFSQQIEIEKECKSSCPESSEMCIQMCA